jgi:hypothetical protein
MMDTPGNGTSGSTMTGFRFNFHVLQKRQERFQVKYNLELEMKWEVIELR